MKILTVFGTRPEAIKLAPVLQRLEAMASDVQSLVCVTGQHRQMVAPLLEVFGIQPHHDLDIMTDGQSLFDVSINTLAGLRPVLQREQPDVILVQGDTTSACFASLGAFYCKVPVAHVEAGLRTGNKYDPFPEEINRTLIGQIADLHFAPTSRARDNLLSAGVPAGRIHVTGNTVVDAVQSLVGPDVMTTPAPLLGNVSLEGRRLIVLTTHRRESFGEPMMAVLAAINEILARNPDVVVVFPVHMNPNVRAAVRQRFPNDHDRLVLLDPLPYDTFVRLMQASYLLITDSGGIQEEAAALRKPVIVVRDTTERIESVEAGVSVLVGRETAAVVKMTERLLNDRGSYEAMIQADCPYGDGRAAERIVKILLEFGSTPELQS